MNGIQLFWMLWRCLRHLWYRYRRKLMRFWDRFKWALVGGLGYMAARFLFQGLRTLIGG